jgi:hypothetical protein
MKKMNVKAVKADFDLFMDVQTEKYLKHVNKKEFDSFEETNAITGLIIDIYNNSIAGEHSKLDSLSRDQKCEWFQSVEIDFNLQLKLLESAKEDFQDMVEIINERFPFLPPDSALMVIYAFPLLKMWGIPKERISALLHGEEITPIEIHIVTWAHDVVLEIFGAYTEKKSHLKEKHLKKAVLIAQEEMDEETAKFSVTETYQVIHEYFNDIEKKPML